MDSSSVRPHDGPWCGNIPAMPLKKIPERAARGRSNTNEQPHSTIGCFFYIHKWTFFTTTFIQYFIISIQTSSCSSSIEKKKKKKKKKEERKPYEKSCDKLIDK